MRNRITGQLLKAFLNHKIKDFGKMTTLHIDTQEKRIQLTANLLGETEPIDASLQVHTRGKRRPNILCSDGAHLLTAVALIASSTDAQGQCHTIRNSQRYRGDDGQGFDGLNRSRALPRLKLFPVTG